MKSQVAVRFIECLEELKNQKKVRSNRQFAKALDYLPQSLSEIIKGRRNVPLGLIEKAIEVFEVNPGYLFLGYGSRFLNTHLPLTETNRPSEFHLNSEQPPARQRIGSIYALPYSAQESYCQHLSDPKYLANLPVIKIPNGGQHIDTERAFEINDPHMEPVLHQGDYVIGELINPKLWVSRIGGNRLFIIVTKTGILVRKVVNRIMQEQCIILHTIDELDSGHRTPLEEVRQIWQVNQLLTKHVAEQSPIMMKTISQQIRVLKETIQAQQEQLDKQVGY